jgi:hypothetical protein
VKDFFGAVDDYFSACFADVLDFFKRDLRAAWTDTVYALDACGN